MAVQTTGNYFKTVFLELVESFKGMWRTYIKLLGGNLWSFDHSLKVGLALCLLVILSC
jgi:hypothetical protein